jgi:glycine/sarcosine N-methyltransferase
MKFYSSIALYYDDIFPYNPVQKDFITSSIKPPCRGKTLLDIGCGTGNLSLELSKDFKSVMGIDLDRSMIGMAKSKLKGHGNNIEFMNLNMLTIGKYFPTSAFYVIICFGNTLVHLASKKEIEFFLGQARSLLKPGGKLMLQIVHYDRILKQHIRTLPLIENGRVRFERYYRHDSQSGKIIFNTILTVKKNMRLIKNSTELYPIVKNEVRIILQNAGFREILFYGGFNREVLTEDSIPLVIEAF